MLLNEQAIARNEHCQGQRQQLYEKDFTSGVAQGGPKTTPSVRTTSKLFATALNWATLPQLLQTVYLQKGRRKIYRNIFQLGYIYIHVYIYRTLFL